MIEISTNPARLRFAANSLVSHFSETQYKSTSLIRKRHPPRNIIGT
jgi:hypothetical protein